MRFTAPTLRAIWWICLVAILILAINATRRGLVIADLLVSGDGDDLARLQQVRDWLGGQSWFDTTQYRLLPPEGVSIHWSRYVDLGIAAFLVPASWFLSQTGAELVAIVLWPTFVGCLAVFVIGFSNNRLLGPAAAIGALVTFLSWGKLGGEFTAGRIDHHNVQILCATAVFYLAVLPGRRGLLGALAGGATALCLAVGLEMLPTLAVIWGLMVLRHAFAEDGTGRWLIGFCASFALAAPLLVAGQVPMSGWWVNHCDVLAPPLLALAAVGMVASLVPVALGRVLTGAFARLGVSLALLAGGLWLAAPLLSPCLAGPYASASPEVRMLIETSIPEALSAAILIKDRPELLLRIVLPPVIIAIVALVAMVLMRGRVTKPQRVVLVQAFVVLIVGFGLSLLQIRAANLMTPAVPFLAGFVAHAFMAIPRDHRLRGLAALTLLLSTPPLVEAAARVIGGPPKLMTLAADMGSTSDNAEVTSVKHFAVATALAEISSLPKSLMFSSGNLAALILVYTPHSITSAGYHRSSAAVHNAFAAFDSREVLQKALASSRADYLIIRVGFPEEVLVNGMAKDGWPNWLVEVTGDRQKVRAFKVDKAALSAGTAAP